MSPESTALHQTHPGTAPAVEEYNICTHYNRFNSSTYNYHIQYCSRFLHPEGLDNLEDVHHSLSLAALNSSDYGTEHARTAHCVTAWEAE